MANHKPKIGFRVDTGNITGTGHLMEIMSLIRSLRKRLDFYSIGIINDYPLSIEKISTLVDQIEIIPENDTGDKELHSLIPFLKKEGISFFVADLLDRSQQYYALLKKEIGNTYVILDNADHIRISASVMINFNILQSPEFYENLGTADTEYLIGPQYAILNESLYDTWVKVIAFRGEVKRIFVNQGGSDPYGLTAKTLRALEKLRTGPEVIVVVGGALQEGHKEELEDLKPSLKGNYRFFENIPQEKMYELLSQSDLALTAAGNTLYELAFFGIPSIIICHHEKHDKVAAKFEELEAGLNMGLGTGVSEDNIASVTAALISDARKRETLSHNARRIVDGYGTGRLADKIAGDVIGRI